MSANPPLQSLVVRRKFRASRSRVFQAWTTPAHLMRWWGPMGYTTPHVELDLRKGGHYRLDMRTPVGEAVSIVGTFVDIKPEERLVYTWALEGAGYEPEETLVTVEFLAQDQTTEVVLTHERLQSLAQAQHHGKGWKECLQGLETLLESTAPNAPNPPKTIQKR